MAHTVRREHLQHTGLTLIGNGISLLICLIIIRIKAIFAVNQILVHRQGQKAHAVFVKGLGNKVGIGKDVRGLGSVGCVRLDDVAARQRIAVRTKAVPCPALDCRTGGYRGGIRKRNGRGVFHTVLMGVRAVGGIIDLIALLGTQLQPKALRIHACVCREQHLVHARADHGILPLTAHGADLLQLCGGRLVQIDLMEAAVGLERGAHRHLALGHIVYGIMAVIAQLCRHEIGDRTVDLFHGGVLVDLLPCGSKRDLHILIVQNDRPLGVIRINGQNGKRLVVSLTVVFAGCLHADQVIAPGRNACILGKGKLPVVVTRVLAVIQRSILQGHALGTHVIQLNESVPYGSVLILSRTVDRADQHVLELLCHVVGRVVGLQNIIARGLLLTGRILAGSCGVLTLRCVGISGVLLGGRAFGRVARLTRGKRPCQQKQCQKQRKYRIEGYSVLHRYPP